MRAAFIGMVMAIAGCTTGTSGHDAGMREEDAGYDAGREEDAGPRPDAGPSEFCEPGSTLGNFCRFDSDCSDLCFCTGTERCQGGVCVAGRAACDDGVDCTVDACEEETTSCTSTEDDASCDDENDCTGIEVCDAEVGCLPGIPMACSDASSCTLDSCDPALGCQHELRDLDDDGYADARCAGGTDCDDDPATGATVHPGASEVCENGVDDNCDGAADLFDTAVCAPTNDTCATARVLPAPGVYDFATTGLRDDYVLSCGTTGALHPDAVFRFTTTTERNARVELASAPFNTTVELRTLADCGGTGAPIACDRDTSTSTDTALAEGRNLPPGDYAIIVSTPSAGFFQLALMLTSPTPPPANDLCDPGTPVITASGSFMIDVATLADDYPDLGCGDDPAPAQEAAYLLRLAVPTDVHLEANGWSTTGSQRDVLLALVRDCAMPVASRVACAEAEQTTPPAIIDRPALEAGDYWVLVEEDDLGGVDRFVLQATLTPASARAPGDQCASAIDVTTSSGSTDIAMLRNDGGLGCGGSGMMYRDAYFSFTLTVPSDVTVTTMAPIFHLFSVSTDCTTTSAELECSGSSAAGTGTVTLSGLTAGTYYVGVAVPTDTGLVSVTTAITPL